MPCGRITGTGSGLPERVMTNADMEKLVDTSDQWIRERTGITQRHIASDEETTSSLAETAARNALSAAGLEPGDLDMIVMGTTTPDQLFPNAAVLLQSRLGIGGIPAFTLEAACTSFLYALSVADKFIRCGEARRILVVGAEKLSPLVDWTDRSTCVLFGDGAGAVVLEADDEPGVIATRLHADGQYRDLLYFPAGVGRNFPRVSDSRIQMKGNEVFRVAVKSLGEASRAILEDQGIGRDDIDWFIPHQANVRIIHATARKLDMPAERIVISVDQHGNTSAASIPLALDLAVRDGRIQRGQLLLMTSFGAGFTWGAALVRM